MAHKIVVETEEFNDTFEFSDVKNDGNDDGDVQQLDDTTKQSKPGDTSDGRGAGKEELFYTFVLEDAQIAPYDEFGDMIL